MPSIIRMPNSRLRAFRKAPAEYIRNRKENIKMKYCEILSPIVPRMDAVSLLEASCPCKEG
ncbi:hypothetical protein D3C84_1254780 [compost metagenome]